MRHKPTTDPEQKRLLLRTEGGTTTFLLTKRRTVERRFSLNISALRAVVPRLLCMGRVRVVYVCVCVWLASILSMSEVCAKGYKTVYTATTRAGRPAGSPPHKILLTPIFVQLFSNNFVMRFACHAPTPPTNPDWAVINACTLAVVAVQRKCFWPKLLSSHSVPLHFPLPLSLSFAVFLLLVYWFDLMPNFCIASASAATSLGGNGDVFFLPSQFHALHHNPRFELQNKLGKGKKGG